MINRAAPIIDLAHYTVLVFPLYQLSDHAIYAFCPPLEQKGEGWVFGCSGRLSPGELPKSRDTTHE